MDNTEVKSVIAKEKLEHGAGERKKEFDAIIATQIEQTYRIFHILITVFGTKKAFEIIESIKTDVALEIKPNEFYGIGVIGDIAKK
jgi:hypothetical protein